MYGPKIVALIFIKLVLNRSLNVHEIYFVQGILAQYIKIYHYLANYFDFATCR